ncbi:MAG: type ISP restriction/modification enzyme, partial [Syntrophales bacterium]|nr:type ISP restriction/modification enzyme [Syntrophales bacterium]
YAQTIAYGLLAARLSRPMGIIAENVADMVPVTNPFLRDMLGTFLTIGGRKGKLDFDELGIQDVVDLLNSPDTHMEAILRDFGNRTRQEDPVIHFYELFLAEYDKKMKVKRGVFYTPQPVVSYIVRSVHELLQTEFGLADGLADTTTWGEMAARHAEIKIPDSVTPDTPFVHILDPATGTATFLVEVIDVIYKTMTAKWRKQGRLDLEFVQLWNEYVPKRLLPRLYGYELLMAPYAIAHMKIGLKLYETGYRFGSDERVQVYLTNALEPPQDFSDRLAFDAPSLAHEAYAVNAVKRGKRFTVVIGNPPYSNFGQLNRIPFILNLLKDYKRGLNEKKLNLDDDFIKFLRLGQYCISQAQSGVLGMITNNTFIDGATRRCMRASIAESFDAIRIVDLHGNSIERETAPDGSVDQNVFDIQQGVAICLFSRLRSSDDTRCTRAGHVDVFGLRNDKYRHLGTKSIINDNFQGCDITPPFYRFQPFDMEGRSEYDSYTPLDRIFLVSGSGVSTDRDDLCFDHDPAELADRMRTAFDGRFGREFADQFRIKDSSSYDLTRRLRIGSFDNRAIRKCLYRLFDVQWLYYEPGFTSRPAWDVMQHLIDGNVALLAKRQARDGDYNWFFVVKGLVVNGLFSIDNKGREQAFPLYLRPDTRASQRTLIGEQTLNLRNEFVKEMSALLGPQSGPWSLPKGVTPEELLHYAYAVFHSPTYRTRYAEFLKIDFPRLPLTSSLDLFRNLARLGSELVALHLVEAPVQTGISIRHDETGGWTYAYATPPPVRITFNGPVEPVVEKVGWSDDTVWIDAVKPNKGVADVDVTGTVGFRGVPEEVWNFHIGGYQVCQKWLKDRKGRTLDADDLVHYHRIVVALHETIRLMAEIDRVIAVHGGWPEAFMANKL